MTRALLGAINWTAGAWFRPDGPESSTAVATETADFLVRGLDNIQERQGAAGRELRDA